jgi:uncharacterized membrane protein
MHFMKYVLLAMGLGFMMVGIVFFFAYNWADLHRFIKLGTVATLLVISIMVSLSSSLLRIRRWFLLAATILTGALLAVYGQIYQTGADTFDFFLAWSVFSIGWAVSARFPLLWLVFVSLLNISLLTWLAQRQPELNTMTALFLSGTLNGLNLWISLRWPGRISNTTIPEWYLQALGLFMVGFHTLSTLAGIYNGADTWSYFIAVLIPLQCSLLLLFGLKRKSIFWLSILGLALIIVIAGALLKISNHESMFLIVSLIVAGSVAGLIAGIALLQKRWENGTR